MLRHVVAAMAFAFCATSVPVSAQPADGVAQLLRRLEAIVKTGDAEAFLAAAAEPERERLRDFASGEVPGPAARTIIQERDRVQLAGALPGDGYRLMVDLFAETAERARVSTWRLDVRRTGDGGTDRDWTIVDADRVSSVEGLYRIALNTTKQFTARDLKISAEDLDLTLSDGSVFIAEVDQGVTALVLLGRGMMSFHPDPQTEKGQVKIFTGSETLETAFDAAFVRLNPADFDQLQNSPALQPKPTNAIDPRELKRALEVFREESAKSFVIDLGDLSRDAWSLLPGPTDFLAEVHTRRYDTITYARSASEAEDITLFDRKRHRNIALYASRQKLAARGRFYNEDDLVDYDVIDYDVDVTAIPDRQWIEGRTRIYLKTRAYVLNSLTLKLADSLVVQSIISNELGRLFGIRVKNQNTIVVNLPATVLKDTTLTVTVSYAGRLEAQAPEREAAGVTADAQQRQQEGDAPLIAAEPSYLYSSRSFWYPQAVVSDYATARIRLTVPAAYEAVASGELEPGFPTMIAGRDPTQNRKLYAYVATQPLRYLAFVISRFIRVETVTIGFAEVSSDKMEGVQMPGLSYRSLNLSIEANPRQTSRGHDLAERAADIATFYQSLIGDSPYSSFAVALVESDLPGGHSPAYFASLNQPLPTSQLVWRNDPAAFNNFPDFFIAHEIAHQWWGQAVGWRNYHEQWISEGFAQYFAALYAQHQRGDDAFTSVIRQLRRWGVEQSDQGPVSLGYRLGHIRGESRVFRALVYNKGAAVLHMLRRLVGDDAFFSGLRRFYRANRFKKTGTEDFRAAMEAASGRSLDRFFERWIYGSTLPKLAFTHRIEGPDVVLHFEQSGELFDVPVTVVLNYGDRKSTVVVPVSERVVDKRIRLEGTLRSVDISKDDGTLAEISKTS